MIVMETIIIDEYATFKWSPEVEAAARRFQDHADSMPKRKVVRDGRVVEVPSCVTVSVPRGPCPPPGCGVG